MKLVYKEQEKVRFRYFPEIMRDKVILFQKQ